MRYFVQDRIFPQGKLAAALSRRTFLKAALATAPYLYLAGCGSSSSSSATYDSVVVGSGMAGLAAASTLAASGLSVLVLEGRNRIGGRTYTNTSTFAVPVDLGGQWFHQSPSNALRAYAAAHGYGLMAQSPELFYNGTQPAPPQQYQPAESMIDALESEIETAGEAASHGSPDESAAQATANLVGQPWSQLGEAFIGPLDFATAFPKHSSQDFFNYSIPQPGDTMIAGGMGSFVASFAAGLNIQLATPVNAIAWGNSDGVQLTTPRGTVRARTAVVTTPMGGLAAGVIGFNPALPSAYLDAIAGLPMGNFEKIFLGFSRQVFDTPTNSLLFPLVDSLELAAVQAPLWGGNVAFCFVGGAQARQLVSEGSAAMIAFAQQQVSNLFGSSILNYYQNALTTAWLNDPWTQGSYSYATPGNAGARQQLAQPLADQVFFAGEALSVEYCQTVNGAYLTGLTAANQVLAALGRPSISQAA